jgi:hypothetical protein
MCFTIEKIANIDWIFFLESLTIKKYFYEKIIDNDDHRPQFDDPIATRRAGKEHAHRGQRQ